MIPLFGFFSLIFSCPKNLKSKINFEISLLIYSHILKNLPQNKMSIKFYLILSLCLISSFSSEVTFSPSSSHSLRLPSLQIKMTLLTLSLQFSKIKKHFPMLPTNYPLLLAGKVPFGTLKSISFPFHLK